MGTQANLPHAARPVRRQLAMGGRLAAVRDGVSDGGDRRVRERREPALLGGRGTRGNRRFALSLGNGTPLSKRASSTRERFDFAFAPAYRAPARAFGITPGTAWVQVDHENFEARFGHWHVSTPLANIEDVALTGPYAFWKTAGPARLAITDRGLTFATNGDRGVLISFSAPVRGLDPLGIIRHHELTVTVADVDGLAELLRARTG